MQDRIKDLLGRGIPATNVAMAVGCEESYISQLMSDEAFRTEVQNLKAANFSKFTESDDALDAAEAKALKKVAQLVDFVTKPGEAARCFQILNAARRRVSDSTAAAQAAPSTIVNISLPQVARVAMLTDHNKQVIEVDGRPLITMSAKQLVNMSEAARAQRVLEHKVPATLPIEITKLSQRI